MGPGRLGRSLDILLRRAGRSVSLVGRGQHIPPCDLLLLTVPDEEIPRVAARLPPGPVVLHFSGATDLTPLAHRTGHGSLHPIMTFPGPEVALPDLHGVPAAIDGDELGLAAATALATELGLRGVRVAGDRRLYHAAAVLAGNGATTLLVEACRTLVAAGVAPDEAADLLLPLAQHSLDNAALRGAKALTGPAARGDHAIIEGHLDAMVQHNLDRVAALHRAVMAAALALGSGEDPAQS